MDRVRCFEGGNENDARGGAALARVRFGCCSKLNDTEKPYCQVLPFGGPGSNDRGSCPNTRSRSLFQRARRPLMVRHFRPEDAENS